MRYGDLTPDKYRRAEVRAAVNAEKAKKTPGAAYEFKVQQLANHHMFNEVSNALRTAQQHRTHIKGVQNRIYKAATVDPEYSNQMRQLAKSYDTSRKPKME